MNNEWLGERLDASTMRALGFMSIPANEARKNRPLVSENGDDVWCHIWKEQMWVQGLPSGQLMFRMIFSAGLREGERVRTKMIRDALGIWRFET